MILEQEKIPTILSGVWLQPLQVIQANGGPVLHFLRKDYALAPKKGFGEIYFSEVLPGAVKAWKRHKQQTQLFAVPMGQIQIVLYDSRPDSPTNSQILSLPLGRPDNYKLLCIPPGLWYGFKAISPVPALIGNCVDIPHDPAEADKLPMDAPEIPYKWV